MFNKYKRAKFSLNKMRGNSRGTFINFLIIALFFVLITSFIIYFDDTDPHIQAAALNRTADKMSTLVTSAHWLWRAKGSPNRIMLVDYDDAGKETNRRPVTMSDLGWPRVEPSDMGCADLWDNILDMPMQINTFRVKAEFVDGINTTGKILDSKCRYKLAMGASFEYWVYTGRVVKYD